MKAWRWLLWTLVGGVALLAAGEGCLRLLDRAAIVGISNPIVEDARVGFALQPDFRGRRWRTFIETDRDGHRIPPVAVPGSSRATVANLGDSTTFGVSVAAESTYSARLATRLEQARPGEFQVANLGVPGYSTREGLALATGTEQLDRLCAAVVTAYFGWNDHWLRRPEARPPGDRPWPRLRRLKAFSSRNLLLVQGIDLLRARALGRWRARGERAGNLSALDRLTAGEAEDVRPQELDPARLNVPPERYVENLGRLAAAVRSRGARFVVMVAPFGGAELLREFIEHDPVLAPRPFYYHDDYAELTVRAAAEYGFELLDLRADFAAGGRRLFADPIHPSAAGHELIAERLSAAILGGESTSRDGPRSGGG